MISRVDGDCPESTGAGLAGTSVLFMIVYAVSNEAR